MIRIRVFSFDNYLRLLFKISHDKDMKKINKKARENSGSKIVLFFFTLEETFLSKQYHHLLIE